MQFFYLQQEATVRTEAVILLKIIYENHELPQLLQEKIFDCMTYAILQDQNKLVKLEALRFWHVIIKKELEHEGMVDGVFPTVTFSKVYKKIITFDDVTIEKCLLRVLHRLDSLGGLNVFLQVFENEKDEEIVNAATNYITKLADLLKQYLFVCPSHLNSDRLSGDVEIYSDFLSHEYMDEFLNLGSNTVVRYPKSNTNQRNHQTAFIEFMQNFHRYCDRMVRLRDSTRDLETALNKIFLD